MEQFKQKSVAMMRDAREKSTLTVSKFQSPATTDVEVSKLTPVNFDLYMPWACKLFQLDVVIQSTNLSDSTQMRSTKPKKSKKTDAPIAEADAAATPTDAKDKSSTTSLSAFMGSGFNESADFTQILATYDHLHKLTKLGMLNNKIVPRTLLIILSLIIKFYPYLTTLTVNSGIDMFGIYEISKFLPNSSLKEIILDGTRMKNPNYHILLETKSHLTCLSLARCQIDDDMFKHITELLAFPHPASSTLTFLNVSSNRITDTGASYMADALRTNRKLACLNLTGNIISDIGASYIFDILLEFPIVAEEMDESKLRRLKYIKKKAIMVARFVAELKAAEELKTYKKFVGLGTKSNRKNSSDTNSVRDIKTIAISDRIDYSIDKADCLATKALGDFKDPFQFPYSFTKNGKPYCTGNTVLASLNLSYNNLTYVALKKLLEVLKYQKCILQKPRGLFRVGIEGNYLPIICDEYNEIKELLNSSIDFYPPAAKKKATIK